MRRFAVATAERTDVIVAPSASAALESELARRAPIGARLLDAAGVTLATRDVLDVEALPCPCWAHSPYWPADEAPTTIPDLATVLAPDESGSFDALAPDLDMERGSQKEAKQGPASDSAPMQASAPGAFSQATLRAQCKGATEGT